LLFWVGESVRFDLSCGQFRATGLMSIVGGRLTLQTFILLIFRCDLYEIV